MALFRKLIFKIRIGGPSEALAKMPAIFYLCENRFLCPLDSILINAKTAMERPLLGLSGLSTGTGIRPQWGLASRRSLGATPIAVSRQRRIITRTQLRPPSMLSYLRWRRR